jgi:hypothetical protein
MFAVRPVLAAEGLAKGVLPEVRFAGRTEIVMGAPKCSDGSEDHQDRY